MAEDSIAVQEVITLTETPQVKAIEIIRGLGEDLPTDEDQSYLRNRLISEIGTKDVQIVGDGRVATTNTLSPIALNTSEGKSLFQEVSSRWKKEGSIDWNPALLDLDGALGGQKRDLVYALDRMTNNTDGSRVVFGEPDRAKVLVQGREPGLFFILTKDKSAETVSITPIVDLTQTV